MFLSILFGKRPDDATAHRLYVVLAAQSRQPAFYSNGGVPDNLDGRFDMLALHMFLVLRRLSRHQGSGASASLAQQLFDVMFGDMDQSLREMGVGDLTVGKRIRAMSEAFYGRVEAYEAGLQATDGNATLMSALERNLYRGNPPGQPVLAGMAAYMRATAALLEGQSADDFLAGKLTFALPPIFS
jgi:cytochrome b pre-mRNA-processing protein 3